MIISKPPNKVYDEQWERIYGRNHANADADSNEDADHLDKGAKQLGELPEATANGTE